MKKKILIMLAVLAAACLIAMPFLCTHTSMLPEVSTAYYEQKAREEALTATGPEAELMRMLLGLAADAEVVPMSTSPVFTWYGLMLTVSALFAIVITLRIHRKHPELHNALLWAVILAVPSGLLGARLIYCLVNLPFYLSDIAAPEAMLKVWDGGLSLAGALIFIGLAGVIGARLGRQKVGIILHAMVPGMLILIIGAASANNIVGMGYGPEVSKSFFSVNINGVERLDTSWLMIVLLSMTLLISTLCMQKENLPADKRFAVYVFLYGAVMILLESLRRDGHMLWGFVHAEMLLDLLFALPGLLYLTRTKKQVFISLLATAVLTGAVVALEFALDRSAIGDGLLYGVYVAVLAGYVGLGCVFIRKEMHIKNPFSHKSEEYTA